MRIVVDLQAAQAENRKRGIGRYSLSLVRAMVRDRGDHEIILALNGQFSDTIEPIRAAFDGLLSQENIHAWSTVTPVAGINAANDGLRQAAELVREAFLASLKPDVVLTTSLFEGLVDDAVTSIGSFASQLPTAVILYDLIPLIYRNLYLKNPVVERWYMDKLNHLKRADLLLSISASSGREAVEHLGFSAEKVVNISTACDSHFQPKIISDDERLNLQKTYGLSRPFVMYTGGIDHRKNIEGLIRAYAGLPEHIRTEHQLAVVCSIQPPDRERLLQLAKKGGMTAEDMVITGFVPEDDLLTLCNACKLFVFPSWHEGFGLPALEAMACGRAVIGSNTSSIPEVIGREDALFDPFDDAAITRKMTEVLTDEDFRIELERHNLDRAKGFSWEQSACHAWQALEALVEQRQQATSKPLPSTATQRPRLAYISPLPPEQSGIADYSAELLPELAKHYDITVVVAQEHVSDAWIQANCPIRDINWFRDNARDFDRVLYHFGNSAFHGHMFDLLRAFPGIVVLHDFFLSGIIAHLDVHGLKPRSWAHSLMHAHGWPAVQARYQAKDTADVIWKYPCNLEVLQQALGVVVHSGYSQRLAESWYGADATNNWAVIPLLRVPAPETDRCAARRKMGVKKKEFIVCSFGILGPTKLNHRLLAAWMASPMANDARCRLVFVGQNHDGVYGAELVRAMRDSKVKSRIEITGRADAENYRTWLAAADVGVQLRTLSRGETSASVLDCMNYGLATIVNANGSMADMDEAAVWKLPDEFSDEQLIEALKKLWEDESRRHRMGKAARNKILRDNNPGDCAEQYAEAIERFYRSSESGVHALPASIARLEANGVREAELIRLAEAIARNFPSQGKGRQLLVDVSELVQRDVRSGIQRVVRSILCEWLTNPPAGIRVEPVYAVENGEYRYARRFTLKFLGGPDDVLNDDFLEYCSGDVFLGLDLQPQIVGRHQTFYQQLRRQGVQVHFVVYDLLCISMPQHFVEGGAEGLTRWLEVVAENDGAVCISKATADELIQWQLHHGLQRLRPFKIGWFHLGADVESSVPTRGLPDDTGHVLKELSCRPTFLTVGTVEPRKGHAQILDAFELLWKEDIGVNLVVVGKQGWKMESLVGKLRNHCEFGRRLFWLEGISDEYLEKIYASSTCLIAASEGEGFGLPLIEAAQHHLPIIARDIPVFHEVAGEYAFYFKGLEPQNLSEAINNWLALKAKGKAPQSKNMPWLTWRQSAQQLLQVILPEGSRYAAQSIPSAQKASANEASPEEKQSHVAGEAQQNHLRANPDRGVREGKKKSRLV